MNPTPRRRARSAAGTPPPETAAATDASPSVLAATAVAPAASPTPPTDAEIHAGIIAAVMDHRLLPGTKLVEDKLGQAFGVSRTRIRQVLIRLAHEQVVTLSPNRGATLAQPTVQEAREVFEARRLIEPTLFKLALEHADDTGLRSLAQMLQDEEAAIQGGDRQAALTLSGAFHLRIAELSGHRTLERMLRELVSRTSLVLMSYGAVAAGPVRLMPREREQARWVDGCSCKDHRALLNALRKRDATGGMRLMVEHLQRIEAGLCFNLPEPQATDLVDLLRRKV